MLMTRGEEELPEPPDSPDLRSGKTGSNIGENDFFIVQKYSSLIGRKETLE